MTPADMGLELVEEPAVPTRAERAPPRASRPHVVWQPAEAKLLELNTSAPCLRLWERDGSLEHLGGCTGRGRCDCGLRTALARILDDYQHGHLLELEHDPDSPVRRVV